MSTLSTWVYVIVCDNGYYWVDHYNEDKCRDPLYGGQSLFDHLRFVLKMKPSKFLKRNAPLYVAHVWQVVTTADAIVQQTAKWAAGPTAMREDDYDFIIKGTKSTTMYRDAQQLELGVTVDLMLFNRREYWRVRGAYWHEDEPYSLMHCKRLQTCLWGRKGWMTQEKVFTDFGIGKDGEPPKPHRDFEHISKGLENVGKLLREAKSKHFSSSKLLHV